MAISPTTLPNYSTSFTDCVLYLDMNGDAKDVTNNNNDGTVTGATPTTDHFGNANRAYSFTQDGSDEIVLGDVVDVGTSDFSLSCWVYKNSTSSSNIVYFFSKQGTDPRWYFGYRGSDNLLIALADDSSTVVSDQNTVSIEGGWHMLTATFDRDGNIQSYVDGASVGSGTNMSSVGNLNNGNTLTIGNRTDTGEDGIGGKLTQAIIWTKALSADEVKSLYQITKQKYIYPYPRGVGE